MKNMPVIPNFTPTKYSTNEDKQKFVKTFIRFVNSGFNPNIFTKGFYNRLSNCRNHIAHYNRQGFYSEWFSTPDRKANFLRVWMVQPIYGDPDYTYSDVEVFLRNWLRNEYMNISQSF